MSATIKSFEKDGKSYPTIELKKEGSKNEFGFTFGLSKAKLILDHLDNIKAFVEEYGEQK